jgi:dipeptidyl aminopeptidase/acylaminoacyl peptidase
VREETVAFNSEGSTVAGLLRLPDTSPGGDGAGPYPAIVQGPGWLQLKEAKRNPPYHRALTDAGFAVLVIDFRGFGGSEGDGRDLLPDRWLEDLVNAVTYLTTRSDIDPRAMGTFGSGSTGGGNAVRLAAVDPRIRCTVAQTPISDGGDWLRRMRSEAAWQEFLARLDADRRTRVLGGEGALVHPRRDLMVTTPERAEREARQDVEDGHVHEVSLRSADALIAYRPIDVAGSVARLLVIGVEDDAVTPTDHAIALYERARAPKELLIQRGTSHYAAYDEYAHVVIPAMVDWFRRYLRGEAIGFDETTDPGVEVFLTTGDEATPPAATPAPAAAGGSVR